MNLVGGDDCVKEEDEEEDEEDEVDVAHCSRRIRLDVLEGF